jgi:hypothetical protein
MLTADELNQIAGQLRSQRSIDPYELLLALGRAMARQHRSLIEGYLLDVGDPMLTRLALQILCKFWGETERYLPQVRSFLAGVPWDEEGDVRQMAGSIAGEYLRETDDEELLSQLLARTKDEALDDVDRADAYISLARAMGKQWEDLPPLSRLPAVNDLIDERILLQATERRARLLANRPADPTQDEFAK